MKIMQEMLKENRTNAEKDKIEEQINKTEERADKMKEVTSKIRERIP